MQNEAAESPTALCSQCGQPNPEHLLNADGECEVCAALMSLKSTLMKIGRVKPDLFDRADSQLPPSDR